MIFSYIFNIFAFYGFVILNYFFSIDNLNEINLILFFNEPASILFTTLIMLHDEVCIYLVVVLVFVYWMLYSILMDYIFVIKNNNVKYNFFFTSTDYIVKDNFTFFEYFILHYYLYYFIEIDWELLDPIFCKELYDTEFLSDHFSFFYPKTFLWFFEGFQSNNKMRYLANFYYIIEEGFFDHDDYDYIINNNNYDLNNKLLFTGCNSNILSLQGKFIEMEDIYLLSNLSYDLFIVEYVQFLNIFMEIIIIFLMN